MIKDKKIMRDMWKKTGLTIYKTEYNKQTNEIKKIIKEHKQKEWQNKCNNAELTENQNKNWTELKNILGLKRKATTYPTIIEKNDNDEIITKATTTEDKIELLTRNIQKVFTEDPNEQFDEEHKTIVEETLTDLQCDIETHTVTPLILDKKYDITKKEIAQKINKLKKHKAPGPDKITNIVIKYIKPTLLIILPILLYNILWKKGYHSNIWKTPL